jgi:hypothetical protein
VQPRFLAVFAVLAGNLQRTGSLSPQKSSSLGGLSPRKTARNPLFLLFFGVFVPTIEFREDDDTNYKVLRPPGLKSQYQIHNFLSI